MRFSSLIRTSGVVAACAAAAALSLLPGRAAHAEILYGITDTAITNLVAFDSATPGTFTTNVAISGITTGYALRAIDFRPANGLLYAVGTSTTTATAAQLYTVNLSTGALTAVGSGFTLTGNTSTRVSIDFNPVADALRVVTGTTQNYRVNATTGALILQDTNISPADLIADVAYSNNVVGATTTTLYAYDYTTDFIGTIGGVNGANGGPNGGLYTNVSATGTGITTGTAAIGFDISGLTGVGYVSANTTSTVTGLYTANLTTGALTLVGNTSTALLDVSARGITPSAAPEPGTLSLLGMGLAGGAGTLGVVRRKRKAA